MSTDVFETDDYQRLQSGIDEYIEQQYGSDGLEAIDALRSAADDLSDTVEIDLAPGVTVMVRNELPATTERRIDGILEQSDREAVVDEMIHVITDLIVEPEAYTDPRAWRPLYEKHGTTFLLDVIKRLREPAQERAGVVESFR